MSGIKQSQARGLNINDPARRAQTTFIALPLVFALFLSSGFAQESPKLPQEDHSLSFGARKTDFTSGYVWRGLLLDDRPLMQPSAWISESGITFAAWTSLPLTKTSESTHLNASTLTLSYDRDWKKFKIEPSIDSYFNRQAEDSDDDPNTSGGENSCSILETFDLVEQFTGKKMNYEYVDKNREADHICYISNLARFKNQHPEWTITKSLSQIVRETIEDWKGRLAPESVTKPLVQV